MAVVFQYGSNMRQSRLNAASRLNGRAERIGAAWTIDLYRFCFPVYSKSNACAAAGIFPDPSGVRIFGAAYELAPDAILALDRIEGANYARTPIQIQLVDGDIREAETYLPVMRQPCHSPSNIKYCSHILVGLGELEASDTYVDFIVNCVADALA